MYRLLLLCFITTLSVLGASAQVRPVVTGRPDTAATDSIRSKQTDTSKTKYVNLGKIAGRRAAISSAIVPGLGQIRNGVTFYRMLKVAGIYAGGTILTLSYIENNRNYHDALADLVHRQDKNSDGQPLPGRFQNYPVASLQSVKDNARRNREVVIFSLAGLYLLNIVEAYVDARLKYFDVGDVAFKVTPGLINTNVMYGSNSLAPGFKITLTL